MMNWRSLVAATAATAACVYVAWGQPFQQPGGSTVPPAVQMCFNGITNSDGSRQVVPCGTGGTGSTVAGSSSNAGSGQTPTATNVPTIAYCYAFDGANWDQCRIDALGNLKVAATSQIYTPSGPVTANAGKLAAGGAAQNLFTPNEVVHGCVITNPLTATDQNVTTAETAWLSFVTTAQATPNSTSIPLYAGQSIGCPGGLTTGVSWIAATIGHLISAYKY